uniref:Marginal zone B and B1 cell specific protein n=1 Tax=Anser cygnoides TaxID=8845 RepID=A0A8B9DJ12_ANSCY
MRPVLAACMALSLVAGPGAGDGCQDPPSPSLSRSVPAPQLSAEELHSPHMPESLRCDACYAIAFQVALLAAAEGGKRGRNVGLGRKALRESDYVEVLERSCLQSWELYGVQELNGEKRLTGPGLQSQQPLSVTMTGGPWPSWPRCATASWVSRARSSSTGRTDEAPRRCGSCCATARRGPVPLQQGAKRGARPPPRCCRTSCSPRLSPGALGCRHRAHGRS